MLMMGCSFGSNFCTVGVCASSGSCPTTALTRCDTSIAAWSTLMPELNSAITVLKPSLLVEVTLLMPASVASDPSMGSETCSAISSEPAPG